MYDAVELEKPDMAFHLGDCIGDAQDLSSAFPMLDLCYVPGNCDYCTSAPASLLQEAGVFFSRTAICSASRPG